MNKFFNIDKENVLYPILIAVLIGMVIVPLLSSCSFKENVKKNTEGGDLELTIIGGSHFLYEYKYKGHIYIEGASLLHAPHCPCSQKIKTEK